MKPGRGASGFDRRGGLGGDYWVVAAYLAVPAVALLLLATGLPAGSPRADGLHDAEIGELVRARTLALQAWPRLLGELCRDPELIELGLAPSCSEAVITLPDAQFFDASARTLRPEAAERLRRGIPVVLARLRDHPGLWSQLETLEIRGHADPRALDDPYVTNLHASQQRALAVLLFLTTDPEIPRQDRLDLQRLALASGASHSRPPPDCRVRSRDCDNRAKRVEIRIGLDADRLRAQLGAFYDEVAETLAR